MWFSGEKILANPEWFELVAILTCVLGVGGALVGLFGILSRRPAWWLWSFLSFTVALGLGGTLVFAGVTTSSWQLWLPGLLLPATIGLGIALRSSSVAWLLGGVWNLVRSPRLQAGLVLVCSPLLVFWLVERTMLRTIEEQQELPGMVGLDRSMLEEVATASLTTDRGRRIPANTPRPEVAEAIQDDQVSPHTRQLALSLIRTSGPDRRSNCHGWVFTGGRYWVLGKDVDTILTDNGYHEVASPQPHDVIVYRDSTGQVLHTGLVQAVLADGRVLIESKWGELGCYLHQPKDQCYGTHSAYYHTARANHYLHGLDSTGTLPAGREEDTPGD